MIYYYSRFALLLAVLIATPVLGGPNTSASHRRLDQCSEPPSDADPLPITLLNGETVSLYSPLLDQEDATNVYALSAQSGCEYTFSFCSEDEGLSGADTNCGNGVCDDTPFAAVWSVGGGTQLSDCPSMGSCDGGWSGATKLTWRAMTTEDVWIGVDTYDGAPLSFYIISISVSCGGIFGKKDGKKDGGKQGRKGKRRYRKGG